MVKDTVRKKDSELLVSLSTGVNAVYESKVGEAMKKQ
jgi:hypothetical protein